MQTSTKKLNFKNDQEQERFCSGVQGQGVLRQARETAGSVVNGSMNH